jgi:hypothetical protein
VNNPVSLNDGNGNARNIKGFHCSFNQAVDPGCSDYLCTGGDTEKKKKYQRCQASE